MTDGQLAAQVVVIVAFFLSGWCASLAFSDYIGGKKTRRLQRVLRDAARRF